MPDKSDNYILNNFRIQGSKAFPHNSYPVGNA